METNIIYTTQIQMDWKEKIFYFKKVEHFDKFILWIYTEIDWILKNIYDVYDDYMIIFYIKDNINNNIKMDLYQKISREKELYFFWVVEDEEQIINNIMKVEKKDEKIDFEYKKIIEDKINNIMEVEKNFIYVFKTFLPVLSWTEKTKRHKYYYNFDFYDIYKTVLDVLGLSDTSELTKEKCMQIFHFWKIREFASWELARKIVLICESFIDYKFNDDTMELAIENCIRDFFKN